MAELGRKISRNFLMEGKDVYILIMKFLQVKLQHMDIAKARSSFASCTVGNILNKNPNPLVVSCHRIICSNGKL